MKTERFFKRFVPVLMAVFLVPLWAANSGAVEEKQATTPSLYERLGGVDNIAVVIDEIIERSYVNKIFHANPSIAEAHAQFPKAAYKFKVTLLVCQATGGPYKYVGRSMKEAHQHLNVTEKEWKELISIIRESLDKYKVPLKEQDELITGVERIKGEIALPATVAATEK